MKNKKPLIDRVAWLKEYRSKHNCSLRTAMDAFEKEFNSDRVNLIARLLGRK